MNKNKNLNTSFKELYKRLCISQHIKYTEEEAKEYHRHLKKYGFKRVERAIDLAIENIKFFPSVAELIQIIEKMPPEWFYSKNEVIIPTQNEQQEMKNILEEMEVIKNDK